MPLKNTCWNLDTSKMKAETVEVVQIRGKNCSRSAKIQRCLCVCPPVMSPVVVLWLHRDLSTVAFVRLGASLIAFGRSLSKVTGDFLIPTVRKAHGASSGLHLPQEAIIPFELLNVLQKCKRIFLIGKEQLLAVHSWLWK